MVAAAKKVQRREQGSAQTLEELKAYGARMGRSPKWAEHVWNARQRAKDKPRPQRSLHIGPPVPSQDELMAMSLQELERVASEQGWPPQWPSEFFYSNNQQPSQHP